MTGWAVVCFGQPRIPGAPGLACELVNSNDSRLLWYVGKRTAAKLVFRGRGACELS